MWVWILIILLVILLIVGWNEAKKKWFRKKGSLWTICKTEKWETVRFKSEKAIADCLNEMWVAYKYEKHFYFGKTTLKPDFYLPEYKVVIEFWGIMQSWNYREKMVFKKTLYDKHWLRCIDMFAEMIRDSKTKQIDMAKTKKYLTDVLGKLWKHKDS